MFARLITSENLPAILLVTKFVFFGLLALVLLLLIFTRSGGTTSPRFVIYRVTFSLIALMIVGVLVYQASWQLFGYARPAFVNYQRFHDRRPDSPVKKMPRGTIRDRTGVILAEDDETDTSKRRYPSGPAFAHVVGYVDKIFGNAGVEGADQPHIEGYDSKAEARAEDFDLDRAKRGEVQGHDVRLTLDARLQFAAMQLMQGKRGAVVVIKPDDGQILALYSAPSFDPNRLDPALFAKQDEELRLLNRATQGLYPPGSTFKMLVASAAVDHGLGGIEFDCPGSGYTPPRRGAKPIRDHEYYAYAKNGAVWPGFGRIGLNKALAKSSNVFFAQLGVQLGPLALFEAARKFQLNQTNILYEGSAGKIRATPSEFPELTENDYGSAAQLAIGQGRLMVTPLQMALVGAAIANDGKMSRPRLDARIPPTVISVTMSPASATRVRSLLRNVVVNGTGRKADIPGLDVCGKTGTAQTPKGEDHAWFVCMAPQAKPKVVVCVLVEHGGFGAEAALPVAAGMLKKSQQCGWLPATAAAP
jgi:peptidoglycan glycosyltransferase